MFGSLILKAEGQIIEGNTHNLMNLGCRVNVRVGKLRFNDIRIELNLEDPNLSQALNFERIKGKVIELVIK